jgi:hypothetical protein
MAAEEAEAESDTIGMTHLEASSSVFIYSLLTYF